MATAAHWSKQTPDEQAAWLLAVQQPAPDWSARLASIDRVTLAKQAPALAASIATQLSDTELAVALLHTEHSEIASQLLANVPQHFADNSMPLYEAALSNKTLRSQSWFQLAKLDDYQAQSKLRSAAADGERSAIAAWLQQQGEQALPELQRWLASKAEKQQLNAIYALRLLATPGAQQLLSKARSDHRLSARARQELQP